MKDCTYRLMCSMKRLTETVNYSPVRIKVHWIWTPTQKSSSSCVIMWPTLLNPHASSIYWEDFYFWIIKTHTGLYLTSLFPNIWVNLRERPFSSLALDCWRIQMVTRPCLLLRSPVLPNCSRSNGTNNFGLVNYGSVWLILKTVKQNVYMIQKYFDQTVFGEPRDLWCCTNN